LQRAFAIADNSVHQDVKDQNSRARLAIAGMVLAEIVRDSDPRRSLDLYEHVISHTAEIAGSPSFRRYEVSALAGSSYALLRLGRKEQAKSRISAAFARLAELHLYPAARIEPSLEAGQTLSASANYDATAGRYGRAFDTYKELLAKAMASDPKPETSLSDAYQLSRIYSKLASLDPQVAGAGASSEFATRRAALWTHWSAKLPASSFVRRQFDAAQAEVGELESGKTN
jgi:tetratricopeptide (TPR) repeat protein